MNEKFGFIAEEKTDPTRAYAVARMCAWVAVSPSAFYGWLKPGLSAGDRAGPRSPCTSPPR